MSNQKDNRLLQPEEIPENVELHKNLIYREGHDRWKLDLYLPRQEESAALRSGLVFVHGGGWKSGSKDNGQWSALPARFAAKGYVCISVNYRLTQDGGGFPNCVHDVKNAVRWFRAHAKEFHLDTDKVGAFGNSAGAHLVSMLGLVGKDAGLEGDGTYLDQSSWVQAVCASATPSDFLNWGDNTRSTEEFNFITINKPEDLNAAAKRASPVSHASDKAPPFLIVHAEDDTTVPHLQGLALKNALEEFDTDVTWMSYKDGGHDVFTNKKAETYSALEAFFAKHLK